METSAALPKIRAIEAVPIQENGKPFYILRDPFHYSDAVLTLSPIGALIVQLLDGKNTLVDIQTTLSRPSGQIFPSEKIREVIRVLDDCFFMDNERFLVRKQDLEKSFARQDVRPSPFAGKSYPSDPGQLRAMVDQFFSQPDLTAASGFDGEKTLGIIAPHIDFSRGGQTYPSAYRALKSTDAETFVILGISHTGGDTPLILTRKDFETPFGRAETDLDILNALESKLAGVPGWENPYAAEYAHAHEHSIDFQVVFLQYLLGPKRPFRILPILCAFSYQDVQAEIARESMNPAGPIRSFLAALRQTVAESRRDVAYIAGVDFAHVGAQFGDDYAVREKELTFLRQRDEQMMAILGTGDPGEFHRFIFEEANGRRVCGYPALYSLLSVLPEEARNEGRVLKYGQWPDPNGTVTFGSLSFGVRK